METLPVGISRKREEEQEMCGAEVWIKRINLSSLDRRLVDSIYRDLLPGLEARSINPQNPVRVQHAPRILAGSG